VSHNRVDAQEIGTWAQAGARGNARKLLLYRISTLEATFPLLSIQRYDDTTDVMLALISTRAPWSTDANGIVCDALQESMTHR